MSRCLMTAPRSFRSAQLLRTTALLTLFPLLAAVQPAYADLVLDNGNAPIPGGPPTAVTGTWSSASPIWRDDVTNTYVALGPGQTGILTNPTGAVNLTMSGTIDIGGLVIKDNGFTLSGGTLRNTTGDLVLSAPNAGTALTFSGALAGNVALQDRLELIHTGTSAGIGTMKVGTDAKLTNSGAITGTLDNDGTVTLERTGSLTGDVINKNRLEMRGDATSAATITGDLDNSGRLTVTTTGTQAATIDGNVENTGSIMGNADQAKLKITGRLTTSGRIDSANAGDRLDITADEILITDSDNVDFSDVKLNGTRVNRGWLSFTTLGQSLATSQVNGGLLNEMTGRISIATDLDASNYDITNESSFSIASPRWLNLVNEVTNVGTFTNRGTNAVSSIEQDGLLSAVTLTNSGRIDNSGEITVANTIANLTNGVLNNSVSGTITGSLKNETGATINNDGYISGDVINEAGAILNSTDWIGGNVTNAGTATLSGDIVGKLTNSAGGASSTDTLTLGGNLTVGGLENNGRLTVDRNRTLNNNGPAAINTERMDIDGRLTGDVTNSGRLIVAGRVDGTITHSLRTLTSTGSIGGLINSSGSLGNTISGDVLGDIVNNAGANLNSTATITGKLDNDGTLAIAGKVGGTLTNKLLSTTAANLTLTGDLEVGRLVNNGTVTINKNQKLTSNATASNTSELNVYGDFAGSVNNTGAMDVTGTVTGTVTNSGTGKLTSTGTIGGLNNQSANAANSIAGNVTGNVTNASGAVLTSTAEIGGNFTNNGTATVSGKIIGTLNNGPVGGAPSTLTLGGDLEVGGLTNSGQITIDNNRTLTSNSTVNNSGRLDVDGRLNGAVRNDGTLDVTGTVNGKITNNSGATLTSTGQIGALENSSVNAVIAGTVTGDVENRNGGVLTSAAAIGGNVENKGTATLSNTVAGTITNSGTLNVTGTLAAGTNVNANNPGLINTNTLNLSGALTGHVHNDKTMNMTGSTLTGKLVNHDKLNISGSNSVVGDMVNTGTITGLSSDANLVLTKGIFFFDKGQLFAAGANKLTITAEFFELGDDADYDNDNVSLVGGLANSGTMNIHKDDTRTGALLNRVGGQVTLSAALDSAGFDVTNDGDFLITDDSDSVGNLHSVGTLTNSGTMRIETGTTVSATQTKNTGGTMTLGGSLTTTLENQQGATLAMNGGTVTGGVTNAGLIKGSGAINGSLVNNGQVQVDTGDTLTSTALVQNNKDVDLGGTLAANLRNNAAGQVTLNGGKVAGTVNNLGTLTGTGEITGALTNAGTADLGGTLQAVTNSGTLGTNGNLSVASLANTGTVNIDTGDILRSASAVSNAKTLNVSGTLNAALTNEANALTEMKGGTLAGAVTNNGNLTGTGRITGALTNNKTATIAGTATQITNSGDLSSAGDLRIGTLTNTGTTTVRGNDKVTVDNAFTNQKNLIVAGNLVATLDSAAGSSTTMTGGTITGNVSNAGNLGGNGTIDGQLTNHGAVTVKASETLAVTNTSNHKTLDIAGRLNGQLVNEAAGTATLNNGRIGGDVSNLGLLAGNGAISGDLSNAGTVKLGAGNQLAVSGTAVNAQTGTVQLDTGTFDGAITNSGTISGPGTITGTLTSDGGKLNIGGTLTVGDFNNIGAMTLAAGDTLKSLDQARNAGSLTLQGRLDSGLVNEGSVSLAGGTVTGNVTNQAGNTLSGTGTISGNLTNDGRARLAGSIGAVTNTSTLDTAGVLAVASLANSGTVNVRSGEELRSGSPVQNANRLNLSGKLTAGLNNTAGATTAMTGGTVTGNLVNDGTLTGTGTINASLTNRGSSTDLGGGIGLDLVNLGGTVRTGSDLAVEGRILNSASSTLVLRQNGSGAAASGTPGLITIGAGSTTTAKGGTQNGPNATLQVDGTLASNLFNNGTFINDGTLTGNATNLASFTSNGALNGSVLTGFYDNKLYDAASATIGGQVSGDVTLAAGTLKLEDGHRIGGSLNLLTNYALADGERVNAAQTLVGSNTTLSLGGAVGGKVVNEGTIKLTDNAASVAGNLENKGTIDLRNGSANTVLTTQGLSGSGVIAMDVFTGDELGSDKIVVSGGATTGHIHLSFNALPTVGGVTVGKATTLLNVDDAFSNTYTYAADELSASSERIVYSVERAANGDIQLVSQINPAIGAMFANVTLVQSLIGSVINRPTSPYVTGLVTDYAEKPCGVGGWGRATGGHATVKGKTDNQVSVLENEVSANYYGMQGGVDLVCFDDRFAGWDMSFGVLGGVNIGDSRQPIFAIDARNSQGTTGALASITTTDFQQVYGGVYMTGTKGRWTADLQLRGEKTDFELKNEAVQGSGLRIETPEFSSDGITVSGSLAYSMPVKDTGWIVTPNVGFAWSKYSTDSIRFAGNFELEFDDSERQIGFVGASLGKTFIRESENAALHTFATATYFKDFADDAVSRLYNETLDGYETQILTSENLKNYGEVSIGANYVKVLNPGTSGRPRQFSTSARIDGRFGDSIDSVGVTGQFRLQF